MQVVVLLAFIVTLSTQESASSPEPLWLTAVVGGVYLLVAAVLAALNALLALRNLDRPGGPRRAGSLLGFLGPVWLIAGSALTVAAGWGHWTLVAFAAGSVPLLAKLAALLPFVAALTLTWMLEYPYHRAVQLRVATHRLAASRAPTALWSLRQFLAYNVRHHLLFIVVPVSIILLATDAIELYLAPLVGDGLWGNVVVLGGSALSAACVFMAAPLMIVRIWKTRRLPDSPLRRSLEDLCRELGLRFREMLLWQSGGILANAGVVGVAGPVRYILLSDGILESLGPPQVRAIFAHEAGHIVHHHIFYAVLFALSSVVLTTAAGEGLALLLSLDGWPASALVLGMLVLVWGIGFGRISRLFERQSDVYGAWLADPGGGADRITPAGAWTFAQALEEVARLNGIPRERFNWRHGSIASRVEYLWDLARRGGDRREVDRRARRVRIGLWAALGASAAVVTAMLLGG